MGRGSRPVLTGLVLALFVLASASLGARGQSDVISVDFGFVPAQSTYCPGDDFSIEVTVTNMMASSDYVYDSLAYMVKVTNVTIHFYWMAPNEWAYNDVSNESSWLAPEGEGAETYAVNLSVPADACAQTYSYYFRVEYMVHLYFGNVTYAWGTDTTYKDFTVVEAEADVDDQVASVDYMPFLVGVALVLSVGTLGAFLYSRRRSGPAAGTRSAGPAVASSGGYPVLRPLPGERFPIEDGFIYLVKEPRPNIAFTMYKEAVAKGAKGMLISREHPNRLRELHDFEAESILWLTRRAGTSHVDPTELSLVSLKITKFVEGRKRTVVLLEGLEYLITHNDFETVLRFINHLHDFVLTHDCAILVVVDSRVLSTREIALLERSARVVEPAEPPAEEATGASEKAEA